MQRKVLVNFSPFFVIIVLYQTTKENYDEKRQNPPHQ